MTNLNDRVIEAKTIASFSKVLGRDKKGRVNLVLTPASEGTQNQVYLRRLDGGIIVAECRKILPHNNFESCKGNHAGVCRHVLAALFVALRDSGHTPKFRTNKAEAKKLAAKRASVALSASNGEPMVFTVRGKGGKELYFIAEDDTVIELSNRPTKQTPSVTRTEERKLTDPFFITADMVQVGDHLNDPDGAFQSEVVGVKAKNEVVTLTLREDGPVDDFYTSEFNIYDQLYIRRPLA